MADEEAYDVIVLGAGPAGLAVATALRRRGIERLVVLEREAAAGGATRHCGHPTFGLRDFGRPMTGSAYTRRLAQAAIGQGVDIRFRHSVVALDAGGRLSVVTPDGSRVLRGTRVVLALGAREATRAGRLLSGDRPTGVLNTGALQSQIYLHGLKPFRRPVIVGTELVGLSAIWTCLRHGIRPQMMVEDWPSPTAPWPLGLFPRLAGIPLRLGATVTDIRGRSGVEAVDVTDAAGRVETVPCDGLLLTGQFLPEVGLLRGGPVAVDPGSGGPIVDEVGRCTDPAYFATGNVLRPIESAAWCVAEARALAGIVAADLAGRLPAPQGYASIRTGPGVKLVVPQRISLPLASSVRQHLQLRLVEERSGTLWIRHRGTTVWSRRMRGYPERRVLIPFGAVPRMEPGDGIEVGFS